MKKTIIIAIFLLSSCTLEMWAYHGYHEEIGGFFVEQKSQTLVGIGKKYHYIFKVEKPLADMLATGRYQRFTPHLYDFELDANNHITGNLLLTAMREDLTADELTFFKKYDAYDDQLKLTAKLYLQGTRYAVKESLTQVVHFNKPYQLKIREPLDTSQIAK
ncbi:MAG: hypothetical protein Q9N02_04760, partial [Ghiorsea sp.]|nr:hypothetical protein [Ghiorsea sp.]